MLRPVKETEDFPYATLSTETHISSPLNPFARHRTKSGVSDTHVIHWLSGEVKQENCASHPEFTYISFTQFCVYVFITSRTRPTLFRARWSVAGWTWHQDLKHGRVEPPNLFRPKPTGSIALLKARIMLAGYRLLHVTKRFIFDFFHAFFLLL
jgi:hypothetical protein